MIANGRLLSTLAAGALVAALLAACGGGGSHATTPSSAAASSRKPDASVTLTIVPSKVIRARNISLRHRTVQSSKARRPLYIDPYGSSVNIEFGPYNPNGNGAPSTESGPIPLATYGPTVATIPVYSGLGFAYGTEIATDGSDGSSVLASNQINEPFYQIDPGTNTPISVVLSLVPAYLFITSDQTIATVDGEVNNDCNFNVGNANPTKLFTLVPADAEYDYAQNIAASMQTPPPQGINGTVTLSGITGSSDAGGSSTIVATGATWNGYTVYEFIFTPTGNGDVFAPPVSAQAMTVNPDGGYDYLDGLNDPPGNAGNQFTENITITPHNGCG